MFCIPTLQTVRTAAAEAAHVAESAQGLRLAMVMAIAMASVPAFAQPAAPPDPLFATVQSLDGKLFGAYNRCDLATLGAMVSDDLEFYHDQTGLAVGRAPFLASIQQNICGKVERKLLTETLEVYPLKGYGAVELGVHRFRHPTHPEEGEGDAKFVMLWKNKDGAWTLTRVISYEHNRGLLAK